MAPAEATPTVQAKPDGAALLSRDHVQLGPAQWGMICFLVSEVAFFSTLIIVYLTYSRVPQSGPTPAILSLPLVIGTTLCLSSSLTIHLADKVTAEENQRLLDVVSDDLAGNYLLPVPPTSVHLSVRMV